MLSFGFLFILLVLFVMGLVSAIMWSRRRSSEARSIVALYPQLVRFSRVTMALRYVGILLGLVFFFMWFSTGDGRIVVIIPGVVGSLIVICSTVGELVMFNMARQPGMASLEPRRITDWLPKGLLIRAGVVLAVFIWLIVGSWLIADPDGQHFTLTGLYQGEDLITSSMGPFFGWFYAEPMILVTGIFLILAGIGGWVVARRPRNGADPILAQWDDALRRRSFRGLAATITAVLCVNILMVSVTTASAMDLVRQVGANAELNGVPASQIVIQENLLWYGWPGMKVVLWIVALASFVGFIAAAAIILYDTADPQSSEVLR